MKGKMKPLPLTPYAVLLVKPTDTDAVIRKTFHSLVQSGDARHPDSDGAGGQPGPRWLEVSGAYSLVKTEGLRAAWERSRRSLSGLCAKCGGAGVRGTRSFGGRITVCAGCGGAGRAMEV